jgi:CheY-like chemotaxis protein
MSDIKLAAKDTQVLILDDDDYIQDVMTCMLEELGVLNIQTAIDGQDGLRALADMPRAPDLLICDILMPDMDGMLFLSELAKTAYKGRIAIVSGVDQDVLKIAEKLVREDGLNVVGAFVKPVKLEQLAGIVG